MPGINKLKNGILYFKEYLCIKKAKVATNIPAIKATTNGR